MMKTSHVLVCWGEFPHTGVWGEMGRSAVDGDDKVSLWSGDLPCPPALLVANEGGKVADRD